MTEATTVAEAEPIIRPSTEDHPLYEAVCDACRTVHDPEIPVNIYDLGLVYSIVLNDEGEADIHMTLTAPGCPGNHRHHPARLAGAGEADRTPVDVGSAPQGPHGGQHVPGAPAHVHEAAAARLRLPIAAGARSLNMATAAALALGEALRQTGGLPPMET